MRISTILTALALVCVLAGGAVAESQLAERVKDGPGAEHFRAAFTYLEKGEEELDEDKKLEWYERGMEAAERGLVLAPESADGNFAKFANWGRILQIGGWFQNSYHLPALRRQLDKTLAIDPNYADALAAQGGLYLQLPGFLGGDEEKGVALLRRALALDPASPGTQLELAAYLLEEDQTEKAKALILEAWQLADEQGKQRHVRRAEEMLEELGITPARAVVRN